MLFISRHITEYNLELPEDTVIRINLAWESTIEKLQKDLNNIKYDVMLDIPNRRSKPPSTQFSIEDIRTIITNNNHIKYIGISNIDCKEDLEQFLELSTTGAILIPKIESIRAIKNIKNIVDTLPEINKILMLDHDDLFVDMGKNRKPANRLYTHYINPLIKFCDDNNITLLRTAGVIFSDEV